MIFSPVEHSNIIYEKDKIECHNNDNINSYLVLEFLRFISSPNDDTNYLDPDQPSCALDGAVADYDLGFRFSKYSELSRAPILASA